MGRDKLLLPWRGMTLLRRAVALLDSLPVFEKILVTTPARLEHIDCPPTVRAVINPCPEAGQSQSVRLGVNAAAGTGYLFLMADQPLLMPDALRPLLEKAGAHPDRILFMSVKEIPCTPIVFPERFRAELLGLSGDAGGRAVREAHPEACLSCEAEEPAAFWDVDTTEDFNSLP